MEDRSADSASFFELIEGTEDTAQELAKRLRRMIVAARQQARVAGLRAAAFIRKLSNIQRAEFIIGLLLPLDPHALLARIRHLMGESARIRVPLFDYGPELSEYRHRIR